MTRNCPEPAVLEWSRRGPSIIEAHYATHIEGTHLTLEQSERILAGQKVRGASPDDARELLNYKQAFELVSDYLESGEPISEALIRQIHKRLVQGVRGNKASPGEYRKIQNYVVNLHTAEKTYTPPPPLEVTHWLEYFAEGLATQMREVQGRGERVIRRDVILAKAREQGLKDRPLKVLGLFAQSRYGWPNAKLK